MCRWIGDNLRAGACPNCRTLIPGKWENES
jgi:hypothetical protein